MRAGLAALVPVPKAQDPSAARTRIREIFDDITAARKRGIAWSQIATLMHAEGTRAADGEPITPDEVKALYHAERYSRGARRKRRPAQRKGAQAEHPSPARPEASEAPPATPTRPEAARSDPPAPAPPREAEGLRALLARRRPDLREPTPINLGPEDRRPRQETDDDA